MSYPDRETETARRPHAASGDTGELLADFSRVLVVGKSQITRVVVSKIVERSGLKPISESPQMASRILQGLIPGAVVLDGGADNRDCDDLMPGIAAVRRACGKSLPAVILLSTKNGTPESLNLSSLVDVVVTKPITPERLQPVIDRVIALGR